MRGSYAIDDPTCKVMPLLSKQNILRILNGIGIAAIIFSVFIQYGKPYIVEKNLEKEDEARIQSMDSLNKDLHLFFTANSSTSLDLGHTLYLSAPSESPECADLKLPKLANEWRYHCVKLKNNKNPDGSGWLPINLKSIDEHLDALPGDPTSNHYFAFTVGASSTYAINTILHSRKYLLKRAGNDGGVDPSRYEVGDSPSSWTASQGLIGYWPLQQQEGSSLKDASGNRADGTILGGGSWDESGMEFNGQNFIVIKNTPDLVSIGKTDNGYSLGLWARNLGTDNQSLLEKWGSASKYPFALRIEGGYLIFAVYDGKTWIATSKKMPFYDPKKWIQLIAVRDTNQSQLRLYMDGVLVAETDLPPNTLIDASNSDPLTIGSRGPKGLFGAKGYLSHVTVYRKALDDGEVSLLFSQMRSLFPDIKGAR